MNAEIISIGSEITSGQNLDTNSQWLSRQLAEIGIPVVWHTTVADDLDANVAAFAQATRRVGLVLATGGLGPTQDDLTREVMAQVAGVALMEDPESLERITAMFAKRNRVMPDRNRVQALVPAGAEVVRNDYGTAPGVWMTIGACRVAAMPGVPSEMKPMFLDQIKPRLLALGIGGGVQVQRKINAFGMGESQVEEKLLDLTRRGHVPEVGITVSDATISLRILARAASLAEAESQIAPVEQTIRARLGDLFVGVDDEDVEDAVAGLLAEKRRTLSTAEGITAGTLAQKLGRVPGISAWYSGGIVAYGNRLKIELLGVPTELLERHGAVSAEVAEAMAVGCRARLRTDLAVSTVGVAGPTGGTTAKPVGLVYVGLAWEGGVTSQSFNWPGNRTEVQSRTAKMALNYVRLKLLRG